MTSSDPIKPLTELVMVNLHEDGTLETYEGIRLDMQASERLIATLAVEYPEQEHFWDPLQQTPVQGRRPYLHLHIFAPMIEGEDGRCFTVTTKNSTNETEEPA